MSGIRRILIGAALAGGMAAKSPRLAVALCAGAVFWGCLKRQPAFGVWAVLILAPLDTARVALIPEIGAVMRWSQVAAAAVLIERWMRAPAAAAKTHPLLPPGIALLLIQAAGLLRTPGLPDGVRQLCILLSYMMITAAAASGAGRHWRTSCRLYALTGSIAALHGILQFAARFLGFDWGAFQTLGGLPRPRGAFVEADWLGLYLLSVLPFLFSLLREERCPGRWMAGVAGTGLTVTALAMTQVRTAWALLLPVTAVYGMLIKQVPGSRRPWIALLLAAGCLLCGGILWCSRPLQVYQERLHTLTDRGESSSRWRLESFKIAAESLTRSPLTGEGPGSVKAVLGAKVAALTQERGGSIGGLFTTFLFESGLPGLGSLLWALGALARELSGRWKRASPPDRPWQAAAIASLTGLLLGALLFDIRYLMPFWVLLGLGTADRTTPEENQTPKNAI